MYHFADENAINNVSIINRICKLIEKIDRLGYNKEKVSKQEKGTQKDLISFTAFYSYSLSSSSSIE